MPAALMETLPAALAGRLAEPARKALDESLREKRLGLLASGLGLGEAEALAELTAATGLPVLDAPKIDREALAVFPSRLAHEYQIVPVLLDAPAPGANPSPAAASLNLATPWPPDAIIADWIATFTSRPVAWHLAPA